MIHSATRQWTVPGTVPGTGATAASFRTAGTGDVVADRGRGKRVLDVTIAVIALVLVLPAMACIALLVWMHDRHSPFFAQQRIGRGGAMFACLKFRTMVADSERVLQEHLAAHPEAMAEWVETRKLRDDPRITPIGRFLRKSSLDELPQLFNVIAGTMSVVGPRPIVVDEISRYGRYFHHYCSLRPGITGLWQVSGRNDVSYRRRVVLDYVYSRSKSVPLDLLIMSRTVPSVLLRRGSY